jgi:hypothetical protein
MNEEIMTAQATDTVAVASDVITATPTASFEDIERIAQRLTSLEYRLGMIEASLSQLLSQPKGSNDRMRETGALPDYVPPTPEAPPVAPPVAPAQAPTEAPAEFPYFSFVEIETELKDLAKSIIIRSESDFSPEVNPTGRIYRLPTDAAIIPPAQLERLIVPSKEWEAFARVLNLYPTTVWRDPRDREGSNIDYIIQMLHPEGLFFVRMRAVET